MGYKIAFLNPWRNCAENQAFNSLRIAAEQLGHLLVHCSNSMEIEERDPDFVLATASTQAKLTQHPTFGVIHEGRQRFLLNRQYFTNLLTYDGYLTISDSIRRFLENVLVGVGRQCEIGSYYNVPHRVKIYAPVQELACNRRVKITYFGTNWDKRQWDLFQRLDREGLVEIYGPPTAWGQLSGGSYRGALPFDGEAPQRTYARNGAGLVLLSEQHLRDDVISNRVFEIASVGAVAVACDTPWLRKHFGDSLYYFNQHDTSGRIIERLREILFEIQKNPAAAAERAQRAREIFESQFSAEVLLDSAVQYFERWKRPRTAPDRRIHPEVSVIVRCGGRPLGVLGRALTSLRNQTYGRVTAILVMWRDFDAAELQQFVTGGLIDIRVVKCPGGDRSATLSAGLQSIQTPYFAILDDDDAWFPTHLERVFEVHRSSPDTRLVITGAVQETSAAFSILGGGKERRRVYCFGYPTKASTAWEIISAFSPNGFVAQSALLDLRLLANPKMATAEDSQLVLGLAAKAPPRFNYAATAIQYESADGSRFLQHPQRHEDELTLCTRRLSDLDQLIGPNETWRVLNVCLTRALVSAEPTVTSVNGRTIVASAKIDYDSIQLEAMIKTTVALDSSRVTLSGYSRFFERNVPGSATETSVLEVIPPELPWAYGATIDLRMRTPLLDEGLIVITGEILKGVLGFSLFDEAEKEPLFRRVLGANGQTFELHIPLIQGSCPGKIIFHVWEDTYGSKAVVESVTIYSAPSQTELTGSRVDTVSQGWELPQVKPSPLFGSTGSPMKLGGGSDQMIVYDDAGFPREGSSISADVHNGNDSVETLTLQLQAALDRIAAMESSKFWKLRRQWFRLRRAVGLGAGE